jgi:hypothetical protein
MGSVKASFHPPLLLAPAGADPPVAELRHCRHAALWLSVVIEPWQVERSGHLHLAQEPGKSTWREVDLTRHPLRALPEQPDPPEMEGVEADLRLALAGRTLNFFRIPEIGLVSEIGEGREDFRRRATAGLRPQLERRLAAEPGPGAREKLASELASLASSIETLELGDLGRWVRRAELGLLLVAPGIRLAAPQYRALMI